MESYSIAHVEALTGIQAHTLRIWEKRYDFIVPDRTETNIRYYSAHQLKVLLNTSVLIKQGYKISKVAKMSTEEIDSASFEIQSLHSSSHSEIQSLKLSMLELDEDKFEQTFKNSSAKNGLINTIVDVIYPFLNEVGILWGTNQTMPSQEHFVSNLIRRKIFAAIDLLPSSSKSKKKIVLFLPQNERHELGLLLAYFILKKSDWLVYYLGSEVPLGDIESIQKLTNADYFYTFLINPSLSADLDEIKSHINVPILVSGNPNLLPQGENKDIIIISSPLDLLDFIKSI